MQQQACCQPQREGKSQSLPETDEAQKDGVFDMMSRLIAISCLIVFLWESLSKEQNEPNCAMCAACLPSLSSAFSPTVVSK